jgi:hypothetical protein
MEKTLAEFLQSGIFLPVRKLFMAHELQVNTRGQKISQSRFRTEPGICRDDESAHGVVSIGVSWGATTRPARAPAPPAPAGPMF